MPLFGSPYLHGHNPKHYEQFSHLIALLEMVNSSYMLMRLMGKSDHPKHVHGTPLESAAAIAFAAGPV